MKRIITELNGMYKTADKRPRRFLEFRQPKDQVNKSNITKIDIIKPKSKERLIDRITLTNQKTGLVRQFFNTGDVAKFLKMPLSTYYSYSRKYGEFKGYKVDTYLVGGERKDVGEGCRGSLYCKIPNKTCIID